MRKREKYEDFLSNWDLLKTIADPYERTKIALIHCLKSYCVTWYNFCVFSAKYLFIGGCIGKISVWLEIWRIWLEKVLFVFISAIFILLKKLWYRFNDYCMYVSVSSILALNSLYTLSNGYKSSYFDQDCQPSAPYGHLTFCKSKNIIRIRSLTRHQKNPAGLRFHTYLLTFVW